MQHARTSAALLLAGAITVLLAGCMSLGLTAPSTQRSLDYLNDELGGLVLAFDVPELLEPVQGASELTLTIRVPGQGERTVTAVLVPADASEVAGTLPAPGEARSYYLFGFAPADAARLKDTQAWARAIAQTGVAPETPVVAIVPRFCTLAPVDLARTSVSVLLAMPGRPGLEPLLANQSLGALLANSGGGTLPPCAGHSG